MLGARFTPFLNIRTYTHRTFSTKESSYVLIKMVYIVGNVPIMPIIAKFDGIYFIVAGNFFISLTTALSM